MTDTKYRELSDLNKSAFLHAWKNPFRGSYVAKDGRTIFRFVENEQTEHLLDMYDFGGDVCAKDFVASLHFLMGLIRENRRNGGGGAK